MEEGSPNPPHIIALTALQLTMAGSNRVVFLITIFSLLIPCTFSRSSPRTSISTSAAGAAVLDVSASMRQARNVLSFEHTSSSLHRQDSKKQTSNSSSSSSSLCLSLLSRSSIIKPSHKDYKSLTLARLARDSARVDSIYSKLDFALSGLNLSELKPLQTSIEPEELSTPVTSGISHGSGEYFVRIGVGQPVKSLYAAIDTGSDVNWIQCEPCVDCYDQSDPVFNPAASSSYARLPCTSQQCSELETSGCSDGSCRYQVSYGDGSFTVGDFATETITFGNSGSIDKVAIGCGHDNEGLFTGSAGLVGLGGGSLSLPSQIGARSVSYCLVNRDSSSSSTLDLGAAVPGGAVTAPLLRNSIARTYYYVGFAGLSVGGDPLSISPSVFKVDDSGHGGVIVDSGTAVTRLQAQAYNSFRDAFKSRAQNLPAASGFSLFDTCYDLSSFETVAVPTVSFQFAGGTTLSLEPRNYLLPVDEAGKFCLAFAPTSRSLSIIGNVQQQGIRVTYDLANSIVAFSPKSC